MKGFSTETDVTIEASFFVAWNILVLNDNSLIISPQQNLEDATNDHLIKLVWIVITILTT